MQAIIDELTAMHAREAALLWEMQREDPEPADLRARIADHCAGMLAGLARGADPLAGLETPLRGAELFPAAWLARHRGTAMPKAGPDDAEGADAIADAQAWPC